MIFVNCIALHMPYNIYNHLDVNPVRKTKRRLVTLTNFKDNWWVTNSLSAQVVYR